MAYQHFFGFCTINPEKISDARVHISDHNGTRALLENFLDQTSLFAMSSRHAWLSYTITTEAKRLDLALLQKLESKHVLYHPNEVAQLRAEIDTICQADGWPNADSWDDNSFEQAYEEIAKLEGVLAAWQTRQIESPDEGDSPFDLFICLFALRELVAIALENQQGILYHSYN